MFRTSAFVEGVTLDAARSLAAVIPRTRAAATTFFARAGERATSDCVAKKRIGSFPRVDGSVTLVIEETMFARLMRTCDVAWYTGCCNFDSATAVASATASMTMMIHFRRRSTETYSDRGVGLLAVTCHALISP